MAGDFIQRSRHGTVFYFRRRVPVDLRPRLGRLHLYASLRTESLAEAKRRARALAAATDRLFTDLRYMQGDDNEKKARTDYGLKLEFDDLGRPRVNLTDIKPGDEASAEDLAKRMLGVATPAKLIAPRSVTPTVVEAMTSVLADPAIKRSTVKEYERAFKYFRDFVGGDTRLGEIDQERFSEFADHVRDRAGWAAKTKAFYVTSAQRLFTYFASRNSAVPRISTAGLKPKRSAPAGHDREAFTLAELESVLRNAYRYVHSEPAKWWATVAPAFLGVRIEELAQAHIAGDFLRDKETGIHYLQIDQVARAAGVDALRYPKSVKSQAGWRKVPIHPALVEVGFVRFVEEELKASAVTPFERTWKALRTRQGLVKHSRKISDWGTAELKAMRADGRISRDGLTYFHSLRHSFVTLLGKADVSEEWRAAITGHQYGGVNAQVYNKAKNEVTATLPKIVHGLAALEGVLRNVVSSTC